MKTSADYLYAERLRDRLLVNAEIAPLVFEEIYDDESQWQSLETAASASRGCLTITPCDAKLPYERQGAGALARLDTQYAVTAWTLNHMVNLPEGMKTAAKYRAALLGIVIEAIKAWWQSMDYPSHFGAPAFLGLQSIAMPKVEGKIPDIAARSLVIGVELNY